LNAIDKLSKLEKKILEEGLRSHLWRALVQRAWAGTLKPGSFNSRAILLSFYSLSDSELKTKGPKLLAARVAICRAIKSLIARGLLEPGNTRGWWLLTSAGKKLVPKLCPELVGPAPSELAPKITEAYAVRSARGELPPGTTLEDFIRWCLQPGVQVDLDF
jgi:hypothetical protein